MADQTWALPRLKETFRKEGTKKDRMRFLDVKFYPYASPDEDPVFAVVGGHEILIGRCTSQKGKAFEILKAYQYEKGEDIERNKLHSCAWSYNEQTEEPLLCVGGVDGKIKVLNVLTGKVEKVCWATIKIHHVTDSIQVLLGHGGVCFLH